MGTITGFTEWPRQEPGELAVADRLSHWREVYTDPQDKELQKQAGRCMDCGVPFCQQGCPLGNPIPEFNDLVYRGEWQQAYQVLSLVNNFPEFTGRLCPAPCEPACTLSIGYEPVTIDT